MACPLSFLKKFWNVVKQDVTSAINSFFHSGRMLRAMNHTVISLIPKINNPLDLMHYKPINLCNVIYKAIAKILANRMKEVMDVCISKNQSAFVPNRQILDNIIISH